MLPLTGLGIRLAYGGYIVGVLTGVTSDFELNALLTIHPTAAQEPYDLTRSN